MLEICLSPVAGRLCRRAQQLAYFALKDQYLMFRRKCIAFFLPNLRFDIRYLRAQTESQTLRCAPSRSTRIYGNTLMPDLALVFEIQRETSSRDCSKSDLHVVLQ